MVLYYMYTPSAFQYDADWSSCIMPSCLYFNCIYIKNFLALTHLVFISASFSYICLKASSYCNFRDLWTDKHCQHQK